MRKCRIGLDGTGQDVTESEALVGWGGWHTAQGLSSRQVLSSTRRVVRMLLMATSCKVNRDGSEEISSGNHETGPLGSEAQGSGT
ncbi:hypothetical protein NDU88_006369 [Pleurodeles waltl]|uniref:Uncharacterized protein n=1 Tax=Pleurodeles waltl TaxID=8319 RepID=A0AAV7NU76_PLEWA|nr:hypothetical protein NDU88_006369 [Pleurodeles waltl]